MPPIDVDQEVGTWLSSLNLPQNNQCETEGSEWPTAGTYEQDEGDIQGHHAAATATNNNTSSFTFSQVPDQSHLPMQQSSLHLAWNNSLETTAGAPVIDPSLLAAYKKIHTYEALVPATGSCGAAERTAPERPFPAHRAIGKALPGTRGHIKVPHFPPKVSPVAAQAGSLGMGNVPWGSDPRLSGTRPGSKRGWGQTSQPTPADSSDWSMSWANMPLPPSPTPNRDKKRVKTGKEECLEPWDIWNLPHVPSAAWYRDSGDGNNNNNNSNSFWAAGEEHDDAGTTQRQERPAQEAPPTHLITSLSSSLVPEPPPPPPLGYSEEKLLGWDGTGHCYWGSHNDCIIQAQHRHDPDGSVNFNSRQEFLVAAERYHQVEILLQDDNPHDWNDSPAEETEGNQEGSEGWNEGNGAFAAGW